MLKISKYTNKQIAGARYMTTLQTIATNDDHADDWSGTKKGAVCVTTSLLELPFNMKFID